MLVYSLHLRQVTFAKWYMGYSGSADKCKADWIPVGFQEQVDSGRPVVINKFTRIVKFTRVRLMLIYMQSWMESCT